MHAHDTATAFIIKFVTVDVGLMLGYTTVDMFQVEDA